jgi:cold shock protein
MNIDKQFKGIVHSYCIMSTTDSSDMIFQGRVKWFNNKAGYGFITIIDGANVGDKVGLDVFSHHSAINVGEEQYKYLVQGEYVEFSLAPIDDKGDHKYQASSIKGMKGGKLLCETRNEIRASMPPRTKGNGGKQVRSKGKGPRDGEEEWVLSGNNKSTKISDATSTTDA